jgi:hypothetical protein
MRFGKPASAVTKAYIILHLRGAQAANLNVVLAAANDQEVPMKKLILAVAAATVLGGCVAVPVYDSGPGAYYGAPAPAVGVYVAPPPVYFGGTYRRHHRHYRHHR